MARFARIFATPVFVNRVADFIEAGNLTMLLAIKRTEAKAGRKLSFTE